MEKELVGLCMHMLRVGNRLDYIRRKDEDGTKKPEEFYECGLKLLKLDNRLNAIVIKQRRKNCPPTLVKGEILVDRKEEGLCSIQRYRMEHQIEYDLLGYVAWTLRVRMEVDVLIGVRINELYAVYPAKGSIILEEFKSLVKNNQLVAAQLKIPHYNLLLKEDSQDGFNQVNCRNFPCPEGVRG